MRVRKADERATSSKCSRSKVHCDRLAAESLKDWKAVRGAVPDADAFKCYATPRVVAISFRNVVQDRVAWNAFARMQDCIDGQANLKTADYDRFSRCSVVGDLSGTPFDATNVPPGDAWFCASVTTGSLPGSTCARTLDGCGAEAKKMKDVGSQIGRCVKQPAAFVVTAAHQVWTFANETHCREDLDYISEASLCTKVGATKP